MDFDVLTNIYNYADIETMQTMFMSSKLLNICMPKKCKSLIAFQREIERFNKTVVRIHDICELCNGQKLHLLNAYYCGLKEKYMNIQFKCICGNISKYADYGNHIHKCDICKYIGISLDVSARYENRYTLRLNRNLSHI